MTIVERFEALAATAGDRPADVEAGESLSYAELNRRANRLAHAVIRRGLQPCEPVAVLLEETRDHVVAHLAVLKAGGVCVPLDSGFPEARRTEILADSDARLVLTEEHLGADMSEANPGVSIDPESPAYVIYTSGSTGRPKGVIHTHRTILGFARFYETELSVGPGERFASPTSLAYAGTVVGLMGSLLNGAAFVQTEFDSPDSFLTGMLEGRVTIAQLIVSPIRQLLAAEEPLSLPDLRLVLTGGETLHPEDIRRFASVFPRRCELVYELGCTEAGFITRLDIDLAAAREGRFEQGAGDPVFPVGFPLPETEVRILDDGEIAVRTPYLSPGYWRDPELTAERFPSDGDGRLYRTGDLGRFRPDGCLVHLGRVDLQVKVRGYRVNLVEIEAALANLDGVAAAAVAGDREAEGSTRLVAYVEREAGSRIGARELREALAAVLPPHMIPAVFLFLECLPLTGNGKLDRSRLPSPDRARPQLESEFVPARTETETALCKIWSEVLDVEEIGVCDGFFDLGGDSLSLFRMVSRIHAAFGIEVPSAVVADALTVEQMAGVLEERLAAR